MRNVTLFSSTGKTVAYVAWIATILLLLLLGYFGVGPVVWFHRVQAGLVWVDFQRLVIIFVVVVSGPAWFLAGGIFDLVTKQGLFEREIIVKRKKHRRPQLDEDDA